MHSLAAATEDKPKTRYTLLIAELSPPAHMDAQLMK